MVGSGQKKNMVIYLKGTYQVSITRACKTLSFSKSMYYYKSIKDDSEVISKLRELADKRPGEGQDKYYLRIRNEGYKWNAKRVRRVYLMMGLNLRRKSKKRIPARIKEPLHQAQQINQVWSLDFMSDSLINNRRFRVLNIMDDFNRKAISVEAEFSFPSLGVIHAMKRAMEEHGKPNKIRVDNGPEFTSLAFTEWCKEQGITIQFIQPGRPMQNAFIERFNRTFRQDILDAYVFEDISQVRILADEWKGDYNRYRPHESLGGVTPERFEDQFSKEKQICFSLEKVKTLT